MKQPTPAEPARSHPAHTLFAIHLSSKELVMLRATSAFSRLAVPARRALLPIADGLGGMTRHARALPDFLICGAQRSGTTSLFKALNLHPAATGPVLRKGVHYFDTGHHNGLDWYR